jgi:nicotinate-nucleotide--dimethylbenzimidazole phosphoribosyltransferase
VQDAANSPTTEGASDRTPAPAAVEVSSIAGRITLPDEAAKREASAALGPHHGGLGRLGDLAVWLAGTQGRFPTTPAEHPVLIVVGPDESPDVGLAAAFGIETRVVQAAAGTGEAEDTADAPFDAAAAFQTGADVASAAVDSGADLLLLAGSRASVPAAVAVAILANKDVASVVGHAPGMDDRAWMTQCAAVRDSARVARPHAGSMIDLLTAIESPALATATGILVEATARRTAVVLDDVMPTAAALLAQRLSYRTARWFIAGHRSPDPAHSAALERLRLDPVLDYDLVTGDEPRVGLGALLALTQLRAAATLLRPAPE